MYSQWFKTEHDRLHVVEAWPEGPRKEVVLAAIRSSLQSLVNIAPASVRLDCGVCRHHTTNRIIPFRAHSFEDASTDLAA
jgi:hypothetical protein